MKKKRFLKIICCFCLLLCSTFFLSACGKNPVDGYESGSDAPAPDNTPPSTGDDSDVDIDDDGNIKSGEVADFSQYFSGYMVTLNQSGDVLIKDDTTGDEVPFSTLVDRQFDVLAQDILNGLNYVYGDVRNDLSEKGKTNFGKKYPLKIVNDNNRDRNYLDSDPNYSYKINNDTIYNAATDTSQIVEKLDSDIDKNSELLEISDINDLKLIQQSLINYNVNNNALAMNNAINFRNAINGDAVKVVNGYSILLGDDSSKNWQAAKLFDSTDGSNKNSIISRYFIDDFKLKLAQIVTKDAGSVVENKELYYKQLLSKIDILGLFNSYQSEIISYIYNNLIGENLVNNDIRYYNILNDKNPDNPKEIIDKSYKINATINSKTIGYINNDTSYTSEYNPRLWKGYSIIVPAIVKRAFLNTFEGDYQPKAMKNWKAKDKDGKEISYWGEDTSNWASTSLYPYFKKSSSANGNFSTYPIIKDGEVIQEMTTTGPIKLDKIILQPKANTQPVALQLQIATARDKHTGRTPTGIDDVTCYEHDIVVELEVDIMYKAGTYKKEMNSYVPDGESSSVLTIDSRGYVPTYIDTKDPNFDPYKVQYDPNNPNAKDPYSESFRKPYDTNGEVLPFNYIFSIYDKFDKDPATPKFGEYDGPTSIKDMGTIVGNNYECTDGVNINLDTGNNYLQFTFRIKSIKQYSGDNDSELVDTNFKASDVVFDISLMPYTF